MKIIFYIFACVLSVNFFIFSTTASAVTEIAKPVKADLDERLLFLTEQCEIQLKKTDWITTSGSNRIKAIRLKEGYDEISLQFEAAKSGGFNNFTVSINKNGKLFIKTFKLTDDRIKDNDRLKDIIFSFILPFAMVREGIGDFRKAYSSVFSFGYARTNDDHRFYPALLKGALHFSWQLLYDPSLNYISRENTLTIGDYLSFSVYFDLEKEVKENYFNIDFLIFGKNSHKGSVENGTRIMYGFFNGFEYFRPGFGDSIMKWDLPIYSDRPYIQYAIWRALQGNIIISHTKGGSVYSAELMAGAGMGIGPSSLFLAGTTEEEEKYMSDSFRSIKYRKQNYYFSYTIPARILLSADHVYGFRIEAGYNYYFFCPVIRDNFYDMLHIIKASVGYYFAKDFTVSLQYEHWRINSMMHDAHMSHHWNRFILEFRNYF
jgi:hypothetical protein